MNFIWNNKTHRIAQSHLKRPVKLGGLAVPDVGLYYYASIFSGLIKTYNIAYDSKWKQIEGSLIYPNTFSETLWNKKGFSYHPKLASNFFLEAMIKSWQAHKLIISPQISLLTVFHVNHGLPQLNNMVHLAHGGYVDLILFMQLL